MFSSNTSGPYASEMYTPSEVMQMLGYRNRGAFLRAAHRDAMPMVRLNARVIRFPKLALQAWMERRSSHRFVA
jgi:predicted DNA-binding transcriptional regulator AlpA